MFDSLYSRKEDKWELGILYNKYAAKEAQSAFSRPEEQFA